MSSNNGEERLLTLFADAHYYFSAPTPRPLHHRFDKASYVYLYRDATDGRGRLEIANHAGKPEQDAFTGYLDSTKITQSYKHPTLCTVIVDGSQTRAGATSSPPFHGEEHHWRLPSTDPRDEGKFLFRLHTIDLYFWTAEDAHSFVGSAKMILRPEQVDILDKPAAPTTHAEVMSPVVRQLETVAITDPAYHNGQTRNSRTASLQEAPTALASQIPPRLGQDTPNRHEPEAYAPLAYNPAAPPAPEPIKHREKTPPPPEAVAGTGLAAAAYQDQVSGYPSPHHASLPPPPPGHPQSPQPYGSPPAARPTLSTYNSSSPSAGFGNSPSPYSPGHQISSVSSYPPPPPQSTGGSGGPYTPQQTNSFAPKSHNNGGVASPPSQQLAPFVPPPLDPNRPSYGESTPPLESPATQILGNSYVSPPPQPLQHLQPQYPDYLSSRPQSQQPVGGYSDYQYNQPQEHQHHHSHGHGHDYGIHQQLYRPTENEMHGHGSHKPSGAGPGQQPGKYEQRAEKVEKGVNRFLRKLEKRMG
ncbi:hypothetical protein MMC24_006840 [Lignoscripta atroalba]|nr:hypothetical protein [Lignoscripta atroalba]